MKTYTDMAVVDRSLCAQVFFKEKQKAFLVKCSSLESDLAKVALDMLLHVSESTSTDAGSRNDSEILKINSKRSCMKADLLHLVEGQGEDISHAG